MSDDSELNASVSVVFILKVQDLLAIVLTLFVFWGIMISFDM